MSGPSSAYSLHDESVIASTLGQAFQSFDGDLDQAVSVKVTAHIEWAGVTSTGKTGGVRRTKLDGLHLGAVKAASDAAQRAASALDKAKPAKSYTAKSWSAQLRKLGKHGGGRGALNGAGFSVTKRTERAWELGTRTPSKANQAKIREAYDALRNAKVTKAQSDVQAAQHNLASELSKALEARYGSEIRLREITEFNIE